MTTVTTVQRETRRAWNDYADALRGLQGAEYERAEDEAWQHLQATLYALGAGEPTLDDPLVG